MFLPILISFIDVDECGEGSFQCPPFSTCVNNVGSYLCPCNQGYEENGPICVGVKPISAIKIYCFVLMFLSGEMLVVKL